MLPSEPVRTVDLQAGAAVGDLTPPWKTSLAGYGKRMGRPMRGIHDRPKVRALFLGEGGRGMVLVSVDLLIITDALRQQVAQQAKTLGLENFMLAATHTHGGPGNYAGNLLTSAAATGGYRAEVFHFLVDRIVQTMKKAQRLAQPAALGFGHGQVAGMNRHRRNPQGETDNDLVVLRVDDRHGQKMAMVVSFAAHPTVVGPNNDLMHGDYPGFLCRKLERETGAVTLFFNAASAELAPKVNGEGSEFAAARELGESLAQHAQQLANDITPQNEVALGWSRAQLSLPKVDARWLAPFPLTLVANGLLKITVPSQTLLQVFTVGEFHFAGFPCDFGVQLGKQLKRRSGGRIVPISYADGYLGYVIDEKSYQQGWYESKLSFYGPQFGEYLIRQSLRLAANF